MLLRVAVVIPVHGHLRTISEVVKDVVLQTPFPILLVDDGSETPVSNALYSFEVKQALESGRLRVMRFEARQGKGAALRLAIRELVKEGYTHMLAMAPDGRFAAREIHTLVAEAKAHPWDLIVGSSRESEFDGFRLYPLFALQTLPLIGRKNEIDIEILTRLKWRGFEVRVVAVREVSGEREEREIWWSRALDFVRVKLYLFIHRLACLWLESESPGLAALVAGAAVFFASLSVRDVESVGVTPVWIKWAGSAALGFGLGFLFAALAAFTVYFRRRKNRDLAPDDAFVGRLLGFLRQRLEPRLMQPFAGVVAATVYFLDGDLRRGLNEYYLLREGRANPWRRQKLVFHHMLARVRSYLETGLRSRVHGMQNLTRLAEEPRAVILTSPSFGRWSVVQKDLIRQTQLVGVKLQSFDLSGKMGAEIELIPFMGRLAPFDLRPFLSSALRQEVVVCAFAFRGESDGIEIYARPPRRYGPSAESGFVLEAIQWAKEYATLVEGFLKKYPEQWNVGYPFWSTVPWQGDSRAIPNQLIEDLPSRSSFDLSSGVSIPSRDLEF